MKYSTKLFLLMTLFFIVGCASTQLQKFDILEGTKMGVVINYFPNSITHTHQGTTVFSNFEKEYPIALEFKKDIESKVKDILVRNNFVPIIYKSNEINNFSLMNAYEVSDWDGSLSITESGKAAFSGIEKNQGVDFLMFIDTTKGTLRFKTGQTIEVGNYGIYSKLFLESYSAMVYSFVNVEVFKTNPAVHTANAYRWDHQPISGIKPTTKDQEMALKDIEAIRKMVSKRINDTINAAVDSTLSKESRNYLDGIYIY